MFYGKDDEEFEQKKSTLFLVKHFVLGIRYFTIYS